MRVGVSGCEWSLVTRRLFGTRVHGLSAVPVKRRCGRSLVTEAVLDLVGNKPRYVLRTPSTIGGEEERAWAILYHTALSRL